MPILCSIICCCHCHTLVMVSVLFCVALLLDYCDSWNAISLTLHWMMSQERNAQIKDRILYPCYTIVTDRVIRNPGDYYLPCGMLNNISNADHQLYHRSELSNPAPDGNSDRRSLQNPCSNSQSKSAKKFYGCCCCWWANLRIPWISYSHSTTGQELKGRTSAITPTTYRIFSSGDLPGCALNYR